MRGRTKYRNIKWEQEAENKKCAFVVTTKSEVQCRQTSVQSSSDLKDGPELNTSS